MGILTDSSLKEPVASRACRRFFGRGISLAADFSGVSSLKLCQYMVNCRCPEKRSPTLRGRNRTRDIRAAGAPRVHLAPGDRESLGAVFFSTLLDTRVMPGKSRGAAASWATSDDVVRLRYLAWCRPCQGLLVRSCHGLLSRGFLQPIFSFPCGCTPEYQQFWREWGSELGWDKLSLSPLPEWMQKQMKGSPKACSGRTCAKRSRRGRRKWNPCPASDRLPSPESACR